MYIRPSPLSKIHGNPSGNIAAIGSTFQVAKKTDSYVSTTLNTWVGFLHFSVSLMVCGGSELIDSPLTMSTTVEDRKKAYDEVVAKENASEEADLEKVWKYYLNRIPVRGRELFLDVDAPMPVLRRFATELETFDPTLQADVCPIESGYTRGVVITKRPVVDAVADPSPLATATPLPLTAATPAAAAATPPPAPAKYTLGQRVQVAYKGFVVIATVRALDAGFGCRPTLLSLGRSDEIRMYMPFSHLAPLPVPTPLSSIWLHPNVGPDEREFMRTVFQAYLDDPDLDMVLPPTYTIEVSSQHGLIRRFGRPPFGQDCVADLGSGGLTYFRVYRFRDDPFVPFNAEVRLRAAVPSPVPATVEPVATATPLPVAFATLPSLSVAAPVVASATPVPAAATPPPLPVTPLASPEPVKYQIGQLVEVEYQGYIVVAKVHDVTFGGQPTKLSFAGKFVPAPYRSLRPLPITDNIKAFLGCSSRMSAAELQFVRAMADASQANPDVDITLPADCRFQVGCKGVLGKWFGPPSVEDEVVWVFAEGRDGLYFILFGPHCDDDEARLEFTADIRLRPVNATVEPTTLLSPSPSPPARFSMGQYLLASDTVCAIYLAQIIDIKDGKVKVHYLGWPDRWDAWFFPTSHLLSDPFVYDNSFVSFGGDAKYAPLAHAILQCATKIATVELRFDTEMVLSWKKKDTTEQDQVRIIRRFGDCGSFLFKAETLDAWLTVTVPTAGCSEFEPQIKVTSM